jgi:hypothetical protein
MVWDLKTKLVSPQFHVMFDNNFDTVQSPDPNITHVDKMDRLFKTNSYKYDDPFRNEHTYIFSHRGVDIHPENLTTTIETTQESLKMTVNTSGKAGAQIPQLPLGDDSSTWGR